MFELVERRNVAGLKIYHENGEIVARVLKLPVCLTRVTDWTLIHHLQSRVYICFYAYLFINIGLNFWKDGRVKDSGSGWAFGEPSSNFEMYESISSHTCHELISETCINKSLY